MSEKMGQSNSNNNNNNNNNLEEQPVDRLKIINKTVRENGDYDKNGDGFNEDTPWLALESNPEVLNEFSLSIGMVLQQRPPETTLETPQASMQRSIPGGSIHTPQTRIRPYH